MATNTSDFFTFSKTAGTAKNLQKPTDGGDNNLWGGYINVDLDTIVGAVNATSDLIADANQNELVDFTATGSAVNHIGITNAATGNGPTIEAKGDDSNVDLNVKPKGTGAILLKDGDGNELVKTSRTASAVNEITVANAATGNGPTFSATGDDTNIDLNIVPKGSGNSVFTNKISADDIVEKTTDHGVEIEGVLVKDSIVKTDDIQEKTSDHGVELDGVLVKDGDVSLATISSKAGTSIGVTLGTDAGDIFNVGSGKLVVEGDTGYVGIGISNPGSFNSQARNLVLGTGSGAQGLTIYSGNDSTGNIFFADSTSGSDVTRGGVNYSHTDDFMVLRVNDANKFKIFSGGEVDMSFHGDTSSGGATVLINSSGRMGTSTSLREHKGNIKKIDIDAVSLMEKFEPVTFNYKKYDTDTHSYLEELETGFEAGMIVDDIQDFASDFNMLDADGNIIGIRYHLIIPYLIKSIQELSAKVTALENATN